MAIDRLPSGRFRACLMIDGQRYTATFLTEADARVWEMETRVAAAVHRSATTVTFVDYAAAWLAGFIDDAPDRAKLEAVLEHRLLPELGELPLLEVLEADRKHLNRRLVDTGGDGDEGDTRECLLLILEDAVEDLRAWVDQGVVQSRSMGRIWMRSSAR